MFELHDTSGHGSDADEAIRIERKDELPKLVLHLAVLCDRDSINGWQRQSLEQVAASGCRITLLRLPAPPRPERAGPLAESLLRRIRDRSPALRKTNLPSWLSKTALSLNDAPPDIVLDFRSTVVPLKLERPPRLGIWTVTVEQAAGDAAILTVLDCFAAGRKISKIALVTTTDGVSDPRTLREGTIGSEETLEMTLNGLYDAISGWFALGVRQAERGDEPAAVYGAPFRRKNMPASELILALCRSHLRRLGSIMKRWFFFETWNIGICDVPIEAFLDPGFNPDPVWLNPPAKYSYYADPFPVPGRDGELLCEFLDATTDYKGRIVRIRWRGPDRELEVFEAIDRSYHLSYPCMIVEDNRLYCLPEAYQSGRLDLFEADAGNGTLRECATLLEVPAVDPVIFRHEDRWWLFCTLIEQQNSDLHIWHAPDLQGPWTPHANNPVKTDIATARPGGTPFMSGGRLYRPAQDCSNTYGGALSLMEITQLDEAHFSERLVRHMAPP
jgi:hypothetical protein